MELVLEAGNGRVHSRGFGASQQPFTVASDPLKLSLNLKERRVGLDEEDRGRARKFSHCNEY
jgi:hypothetical protein